MFKSLAPKVREKEKRPYRGAKTCTCNCQPKFFLDGSGFIRLAADFRKAAGIPEVY
jgi:hypothetical protein